MTDRAPLIEMRGISKTFGRVQALTDVDLELYEDEILATVGDNGAGKSTLIKILVGVLDLTEGTITIEGKQTDITSPTDAREHGIGIVYQELALVDSMSVASNVFLGQEPTKRVGPFSIVDWESMNQQAREIIKENLNLDIDPTARVEFLSGGERQAVAISRALVHEPDVIVLDEPTAALSEEVARRVNELIRSLRDRGHSVIVIDHDINRALDVADRVLVLHQGRRVTAVDTAGVTRDEIIHMMITGDTPEQFDTPTGEPTAD
jgi:ABC-type sugar transport system ATPase subunit